MGGDLHVGAESQEVAAVGLLVLAAVRDDAHTAHRQHGLKRREGLRTDSWWNTLALPVSITYLIKR